MWLIKYAIAQVSTNSNTPGVYVDQAQVIHELLGSAFEASLRQQLMSGEFNAAILGKALEWLKANNISCHEDADVALKSLKSVFTKAARGESLESMLEDLDAQQI